MAHYLIHDAAQILVLVCLAIACALTGVWLVLRKMAMLANSISHTILLGIVAAWWLQQQLGCAGDPSMSMLLAAAAGVAGLTSWTTHFFHHTLNIGEDASIGLAFSGLFALGIMGLSWAFPHSHVGIEIIMGNADAIVWSDLYSCVVAVAINALLLGLFYKEYRLSSFDRALSAAMGFCPALIDFLLMVQLSLTMMVGFRAVGSFLVLTFLVGPVLCAKQLSHTLGGLLLLSCVIGAGSALSGSLGARWLLDRWGIALSTAALASTLILLCFFIVIGWQRLHRAFSKN